MGFVKNGQGQSLGNVRIGSLEQPKPEETPEPKPKPQTK